MSAAFHAPRFHSEEGLVLDNRVRGSVEQSQEMIAAPKTVPVRALSEGGHADRFKVAVAVEVDISVDVAIWPGEPQAVGKQFKVS